MELVREEKRNEEQKRKEEGRDVRNGMKLTNEW